jgi:hypothetical protein
MSPVGDTTNTPPLDGVGDAVSAVTGTCGFTSLGTGAAGRAGDLDALLCQVFDFGFALVANHVDRAFHQVTHHAFDVATDVSHLGELGRFNLHERRTGQPRQAAGDLGLPDAGGADEDDVVRRDLVANRFRGALPPPAIPQRDGHRLLGVVLPDDVPVELRDDLAGVRSARRANLLRSVRCHRMGGVEGRRRYPPRSHHRLLVACLVLSLSDISMFVSLLGLGS